MKEFSFWYDHTHRHTQKCVMSHIGFQIHVPLLYYSLFSLYPVISRDYNCLYFSGESAYTFFLMETLLATSIAPPPHTHTPPTPVQWYLLFPVLLSRHLISRFLPTTLPAYTGQKVPSSPFALSIRKAISTADPFELGLKEPSVHVLCEVGGELAASQ